MKHGDEKRWWRITNAEDVHIQTCMSLLILSIRAEKMKTALLSFQPYIFKWPTCWDGKGHERRVKRGRWDRRSKITFSFLICQGVCTVYWLNPLNLFSLLFFRSFYLFSGWGILAFQISVEYFISVSAGPVWQKTLWRLLQHAIHLYAKPREIQPTTSAFLVF